MFTQDKPISFYPTESSSQQSGITIIDPEPLVLPPPPKPPVLPPPPKPPVLEYDITDEKGNVIFAKGSGKEQTVKKDVKTNFYQLVFKTEFFKEKERLGSCVCQLERGIRKGTTLHVEYKLKDDEIAFEVSYEHNGKNYKETRTMK